MSVCYLKIRKRIGAPRSSPSVRELFLFLPHWGGGDASVRRRQMDFQVSIDFRLISGWRNAALTKHRESISNHP